MLTNFQILEEVEKKPKSKYNLLLLRRFDWSSEYAFFSCKCGHIHYTNPCEFQYCYCEEFIQGEFSINVEISMMDVFQFEIQTNSLYDSPNFWVEFEIFMKEKNAKTIYSI